MPDPQISTAPTQEARQSDNVQSQGLEEMNVPTTDWGNRERHLVTSPLAAEPRTKQRISEPAVFVSGPHDTGVSIKASDPLYDRLMEAVASGYSANFNATDQALYILNREGTVVGHISLAAPDRAEQLARLLPGSILLKNSGLDLDPDGLPFMTIEKSSSPELYATVVEAYTRGYKLSFTDGGRSFAIEIRDIKGQETGRISVDSLELNAETRELFPPYPALQQQFDRSRRGLIEVIRQAAELGPTQVSLNEVINYEPRGGGDLLIDRQNADRFRRAAVQGYKLERGNSKSNDIIVYRDGAEIGRVFVFLNPNWQEDLLKLMEN